MKKLVRAASVEASVQQATKYDNYEKFVTTEYLKYGIDDSDIYAELAAVEDEISAYGENMLDCPVYWRSDYEEPIVSFDDARHPYYWVSWRGGTEARLTPVSEDEQYYTELGLPSSFTASIQAADEYPKGYFDDYYGQTAYEEYGDLVADECAGMIISKRADEGEEPGGLIYEANRLGIDDFFDLLKCLEGMCYNGKAVEISDYQYKVN